MLPRPLQSPALVLLGLLAGCVTSRVDESWPAARPLGADLATYRPDREPPAEPSSRTPAENPEGLLTLQQALALALLQNPELAAFSYSVRSAEARALQAALLPNPEARLEVEDFGGTGAVSGFDSAETTLQLGQLIELGGKRRNRSKVADLETDLRGWDYEAKRLDVFADTTQAFVEVLAAQERAKLAEETLEVARQVVEAASVQVRAGKVSPLEEIRARVAYSTREIDRERARRELGASRVRLASTWGSSTATFDSATGSLDAVASPPSFDELLAGIAAAPELARWDTEIEHRRARLRLEEALRTPDPTLESGIRRYEETDDTGFLIGVSFPIFVFDRNQGGVREARFDFARVWEERRAAEVRVRSELTEAYERLASAYHEVVKLRDEIVPGARRAFEAADEGYRQGRFGFLDVLDAQRTLFDAQDRQVVASTAYHLAVAALERLTASPLPPAATEIAPKE